MTKGVLYIWYINLTEPIAALSWNIDGLVQKMRNSIANALELRLSDTNPSIYGVTNVLAFVAPPPPPHSE